MCSIRDFSTFIFLLIMVHCSINFLEHVEEFVMVIKHSCLLISLSLSFLGLLQWISLLVMVHNLLLLCTTGNIFIKSLDILHQMFLGAGFGNIPIKNVGLYNRQTIKLLGINLIYLRLAFKLCWQGSE